MVVKKMKRCSKCREIKERKYFFKRVESKDGLAPLCKVCAEQYAKEYNERNRDKIKEYNAQYYEKNKEACRERFRKYNKKNKDKIAKRRKEYFTQYNKTNKERAKQYREYNKERIQEYAKQYYNDNKSRIIKQHNKYKKQKRKNSPRYRLNANMGVGMWYSLRMKKNKQDWESLVDFTLDELINHLEKQFRGGMSWNNYGGWHVDHIIPKSHFKYECSEDEEFKRCWSLTNLQPLWAEENFKKGGSI